MSLSNPYRKSQLFYECSENVASSFSFFNQNDVFNPKKNIIFRCGYKSKKGSGNSVNLSFKQVFFFLKISRLFVFSCF